MHASREDRTTVHLCKRLNKTARTSFKHDTMQWYLLHHIEIFLHF